MFLDWLERRIDPFAPFDEGRMPPKTVIGFASFYLRPIRAALVVLLLISVVAGTIEASLYLLMRWFIDLMNTADRRASCKITASPSASRSLSCCRAPGLDLVARGALEPARGPAIHEPDPLAHAPLYARSLALVLPGGFRRAAREPRDPGRSRGAGTGRRLHRHAPLRGDLRGHGGRAIRFDLAVARAASRVWVAAYAVLTRWFVPRARKRSHATADTRSTLIGRVVDSYTNILTVKLFARDREERAAVREAVDVHTRAYLHQFRLVTFTTAVLGVLNSLLLIATGGVSFVLWQRAGMTTGEAAAGLALVLRSDRHVGLGHADGSRSVRECRRHSGEHADHRPSARDHGRARCRHPRGPRGGIRFEQ